MNAGLCSRFKGKAAEFGWRQLVRYLWHETSHDNLEVSNEVHPYIPWCQTHHVSSCECSCWWHTPRRDFCACLQRRWLDYGGLLESSCRLKIQILYKWPLRASKGNLQVKTLLKPPSNFQFTYTWSLISV